MIIFKHSNSFPFPPLQIDETDMGDSSRKKEGHREITTHVSLHTLHLDGLRELYRHFLRLPDGAIVEVKFGKNREYHILVY